jgi:hypothetical protein
MDSFRSSILYKPQKCCDFRIFDAGFWWINKFRRIIRSLSEIRSKACIFGPNCYVD